MARRAATAPSPVTNGHGSVVTASGAQVSKSKIDLEVQAPGRIARAQAWQDECIGYADANGAISYGVGQFASALAKARMFVAWRENPKTPPVDAVEANRPGADVAAAMLERLDSSLQGMSGLIGEGAWNWQVTGEFYVVGEGTGDTDRAETWDVCSVKELSSRSGRDPETAKPIDVFSVIHNVGEMPRELDPNDSFVSRIWRRHPIYGGQATSYMRAIRTELDEYLILSRSIRGSGRSRTNAGILLLPSGLKVVALNPVDDATPGRGPATLGDDLMEALILPVADEGSASSVVPVMIEGDPEALDKVRHLTLDRPIDPIAAAQRQELIQRINEGMNWPVEIGTGLGGSNHWCVDSETEALTPDGWVPAYRLTPGMTVRSLDHETGLARWTPVLDRYVAEVTNEAMVSIEGHGHSSLTTAGHRWPVINRGERQWNTSADLRHADRIPTGAPSSDTPVEAKFSDAFVELVAWFWTEGNVKPGGKSVSIAQSHTVNAGKVALIRAALTVAFGPATTTGLRPEEAGWRECVQENRASYGGPVTIFHLSAAAAAPLLAVAPDKRVNPEFVTSLTQAQLALFIDRSLQGDGWHYKTGTRDIFARDRDMLVGLELAGILAGYSTTMGQTPGGWRLNLATKPTIRPVKAAAAAAWHRSITGMKITEVSYTGTVSCPVTSEGTWLARRNGKVFYTGNSAWAITESMFDSHVAPELQLLAQSLWSGVVRPLTIEEMVSTGSSEKAAVTAVDGLFQWFDGTALISKPNVVSDIVAAANGTFPLVNGAFARKALGAGDEDEPDEEELAMRASYIAATAGRRIGATLPGEDVGPPPAVPAPEAPGTPPRAEVTAAAAMTAAARGRRGSRRRLGARLGAIDRALFARMEAAASAALTRALERAGNRVRSRAEGTPTIRAAIASGVVAVDVPATLGPALVASLGFDDPDLLAGSFDDLLGRFDSWTARAQAQARTAVAQATDVDASELDDLAAAQDDHRSQVWPWLGAALAALAAQRLYDPHPNAPPLGEHDPTMSVPPGLIRDAMARAGGAAGPVDADGPTGGVATGANIRGYLSDNGAAMLGWTWEYGDSERQFPAHVDLDGLAFAGWDDELLAVAPGDEWVNGGIPGFYAPGDHDGCACWASPLYSDESDVSEESAA